MQYIILCILENFLKIDILSYMPFLLIYVTHPSKPEAIRITTELLNSKLIACATFSQIESMYAWEGRLAKTEEYLTIYKTRIEHAEAVEKRIEDLHKYDVPCIIRLARVEANVSYEEWIQSETYLP